MYKRMLVGFDGAAPSRRALLAALVLAAGKAGEVHALTAVQALEIADLEGEVDSALRDADGPLTKAVGWDKREST